MNPILAALQAGYPANQVLGFLSHSIPQMRPAIKKAQKAGYSVQNILGFLSKNFEKEDRRGMSESEIHAANKRSDAERAKFGLKAVGAAIATPLAANAVRGMASRFLPSALTGQAGNIAQNAPTIANPPPVNPQAAQAAIQRAAPQLVGPGAIGQNPLQAKPHPITPNPTPIAQQTAPTTQGAPVSPPATQTQQPALNLNQGQANAIPQQIVPTFEEAAEKLSKLGVIDKVLNMLKSGNTPDSISAVLTAQGKNRGKVDQELMDTIQVFSEGLEKDKNKLLVPENLPEKPVEQEINQEKSIETGINQEKHVEKAINQEKPLTKGSTVVSPHGVGEIKEIRNGKAIIDVDGKKHQVNEEDLEESTIPDEEVAAAYEELMSKIPEEHRSGFISWAGYDENRNVLGYIPRGGNYEELKDITPEEAKMIEEGKGVARTTGKNTEGLWIAGEDTRGGIISQIVHDRRKKREHQEEQQLKFPLEVEKPKKENKGMKTIFDELSYARNASRERERKKKMEEREKKKRERDEAKKRKK